MTSMETFEEAVKLFEQASPWLSDADLPAVMELRMIAKELDKGELSPAMLAQYGLTYRSLLKRAPVGDDAEDELEAALRAVESA